MVRVFLDANFLIYVYEKHRTLDGIYDLFNTRVELVLCEPVLRELKGIKKYSLIADLLKQNKNFSIGKINIICCSENDDGDTAILNHARLGDYVATHDRKLIKQLKMKGIRVIKASDKEFVIV